MESNVDHVFSIKVMVCDYLEHRSVWYAKRNVKGRRVDNVYYVYIYMTSTESVVCLLPI